MDEPDGCVSHEQHRIEDRERIHDWLSQGSDFIAPAMEPSHRHHRYRTGDRSSEMSKKMPQLPAFLPSHDLAVDCAMEQPGFRGQQGVKLQHTRAGYQTDNVTFRPTPTKSEQFYNLQGEGHGYSQAPVSMIKMKGFDDDLVDDLDLEQDMTQGHRRGVQDNRCQHSTYYSGMSDSMLNPREVSGRTDSGLGSVTSLSLNEDLYQSKTDSHRTPTNRGVATMSGNRTNFECMEPTSSREMKKESGNLLSTDSRDSGYYHSVESSGLSSMVEHMSIQPASQPTHSTELLDNNFSSWVQYIPFDELFTQNDDGDSPLHLALIYGLISVVYQVLDRIPPFQYNVLDIKNKLGQTSLHLSAITGQSDVIRALLAHGASVDARDREGNTSLHLACKTGRLDCVKALTQPLTQEDVKHRSYTVPFQRIPQDTNILNYNGETCLHLAAHGNHLGVISYLTQGSVQADVNGPDARSGRTILHHAVETRNMKLLLCLIQKSNVNIEARTFSNDTPLSLALGRGFTDVVELLQLAGAKDNTPVQSDDEHDSGQEDDDMDLSYDDICIGGMPLPE